jgi:membrane associated rhomboid family serine protease
MGPVTRALIVANVVVFGLQLWMPGLILVFALWPPGVLSLAAGGGFEPWQLVTYAFLHGGLAHLFLNMFALWMFGRDVEQALGSRHYAILYFAAVLSAACVQLLVVSSSGRFYPTVGASGGVFGVLLAFAYLFPRRTLVLLFPPIPMPAWLFVTVYGLIELTNGVFGTQSGIAHFAHLGGMLGAFVVLRHYIGRRP